MNLAVYIFSISGKLSRIVLANLCIIDNTFLIYVAIYGQRAYFYEGFVLIYPCINKKEFFLKTQLCRPVVSYTHLKIMENSSKCHGFRSMILLSKMSYIKATPSPFGYGVLLVILKSPECHDNSLFFILL